MVYNQSCNAASTLDKRRPDLRDELGYIAPPNRKLPPVPGSNYNTCDRIKRGTALSKTINRFLACNFLFSVRLIYSCEIPSLYQFCVELFLIFYAVGVGLFEKDDSKLTCQRNI